MGGLGVGARLVGGQKALEVDRGGRGEQLELQLAGAAASRAAEAMVFELWISGLARSARPCRSAVPPPDGACECRDKSRPVNAVKSG